MLRRIPTENPAPLPWESGIAEDPGLADVLFARQVEAVADALRDVGVAESDVIALKLSRGADVMLLVFAAQRLGATVTLIDIARGPIGTTRAVRTAAATLLVVDRSADRSTELAAPVVAVVVDLGLLFAASVG